jgi:2,4-diaminopentanoate dehydrogenase
MQRLRVIQWTTGKVGKYSLRAILDDPRLELVGVYAYSADKAGRDAGELCGRPNCGVLATNDIDALIALGADSVVYTPLHPNVAELSRLLTAGSDVVSTALFGREGALEGEIARELNEACDRGGSSLFITGVNPGWVNSIAVALTAPCRQVGRVTIFESADCSHYASLETWLAHGISKSASTADQVENTRKSLLPFADTIRRMAEALEIKLDDVKFHCEHATASHAVDLGWLRIEKDTIAAVRASWSGVVAGRTVLMTQITWFMTKDLNADWRFDDDKDHNHYLIRVDGDPVIESRIRFVPPASWSGPDWSTITALPAVSAVPLVHAARPGLLSLRDVGLPHAPVGAWR